MGDKNIAFFKTALGQKVFDDLGTPLLLDVNTMLAPQAYLRISSIGINDPMGYVIGVILVLTSVAAVFTF